MSAIEGATKLEWALKLAQRGFRVFPIRPGEKVPIHKEWPDRACTSESTIRSWWAHNPHRNIGLVMGDQLPNGRYLVAIDVDMKRGPDDQLIANGEASLKALCAAIGIDPISLGGTLTQYTPSGQRPDGSREGGHLIFSANRPLANSVGKLGKGLDTRGTGGYILGAGSTIDGRDYELEDPEAPILALPEGVEALLETAPKKGGADLAPLPGVCPDRAADRAISWLKDAPRAIQGEGGDITTYKVAAQLKDFGCSADQTVFLLDGHWNNSCEPPWSLEELVQKVAHAYRYGREPQGSSAPEAIFKPVLGQPNAPKRERPRSLDTLRWSDFKNRPVAPVRWLWEPFFPRVPFGVLASHPGHGKSILSLQIAVSLATGLPLFDFPTSGPAGAGVLALEDDQNVIHRRLKAIRDGYGLAWLPEHDDLLDQNLRVMVRGKTSLEGLEGGAAAHQLDQLAKEIQAAMNTTRDPPAILFLDTLNAIHGGDENSNTEARPLVATIFGLHDALGCSVWALHHLRKAGSGRNAPALTDRLDPELVRGAGAIVGSARAVVQFGWVTPAEAGKAGLEPENSQRFYAVMGLTKVNDGPLSSWFLLEHTQKAGLWTPTPAGENALAILRGGNAAEELGKAEVILMDLYAGLGRGDEKELRKELIASHFPDDEKGANKLKGVLQDLRRRRKWLQPGSLELTHLGLKKIQELKGRRTASDCLPEDQQSTDGTDFD